MGISAETREEVANFQKAHPLRYPLYVDKADSASSLLQVTSIPLTIVVGKDGKVLFRQEGSGPGVKEQIEKAIEKGLKG